MLFYCIFIAIITSTNTFLKFTLETFATSFANIDGHLFYYMGNKASKDLFELI